MIVPAKLRPRDLAVLILASGDLMPRKRARDQQADHAGLALKKQILQHLVERDPEPESLSLALAKIVDAIGPPTGPTRALALQVYEEWQMTCASPELVNHLLSEALQGREDIRHGR